MRKENILKSETDIFWSNRPTKEPDPQKVNISDLTQRDLELEFIEKHLKKSDTLLEVGCGNGYLTSLMRKNVSLIDAFDFSENMIAQAKTIYGEENNNFFHDNVLNPRNITDKYDVIICVRVLINLRNFEEQKTALNNILQFLKPSGKLILIEGFIDGFDSLNQLRTAAKMDKLQPASINYYSSKKELAKLFPSNLSIEDTFHTGMFDFLTRIIYPSLVGTKNALGPTDFHNKIANVAKVYNPDQMASLARLHGWVLTNNIAI